MRRSALLMICALGSLPGCEAPRTRTAEQDPTDMRVLDERLPDTEVDAQPVELDAEVDAAEDASCEITVDVLGDSGAIQRSLTCQVVGSEGSCDALATCVCRAIEREDLESCVTHLTAPRGAISLADFCHQGVALDEVLVRADWREMAGIKVVLGWTAACAALEAD